MYQQLVKNEYGEPMHVENVLDPYEEDEAYWEEMQHRADDPWYAAQCEKESWYNKACAIFAAEGIEVPEQVKQIFADELRKKRAKEEEERELAKAQPAVDFLNKYFPNTFKARYEYPTPEEIGYAYIDVVDWTKTPYRDEVEPLIDIALEQGIYIEDYLRLRELRQREQR